jgi:hypothetical protein
MVLRETHSALAARIDKKRCATIRLWSGLSIAQSLSCSRFAPIAHSWTQNLLCLDLIYQIVVMKAGTLFLPRDLPAPSEPWEVVGTDMARGAHLVLSLHQSMWENGAIGSTEVPDLA